MDIYVRITVKKGVASYEVATASRLLYLRRCETYKERREAVREIQTMLASEVRQ